MKRPLSPTHLLDNGGMCAPFGTYGEVEEPGPGHAHSQREKKTPFSLCEVCNIQLSSAAQAQVHYHGKSHLKRVKHLSNGEAPTATGPAPIPGHALSTISTGSPCQSSTLPALVRTPSLMPPQSVLDVKPFLSFPVDSASPVGLFPNFNTMDPVQKAVINHTFGVCVPPKKKQVISCTVCQLRFNSDSQAEAHYRGSKHAKKLKALDSSKNKQKTTPTKDSTKTMGSCPSPATSSSAEPLENSMASPTVPKTLAPPKAPVPTATGVSLSSCLPRPTSQPAPSSSPAEAANQAPLTATPPTTAESEEERARKLLYCSLCKVAVNSLSQLEAHSTGSKHKTMQEARDGAGPIKAYPRPGAKLKVQAAVIKGSGLQNKTFHCEICDVYVNSEIQLKQHISSRRHKDRVAGKPLKPKYSPYSKQQRGNTALAVKLALQKDLAAVIPGLHFQPLLPDEHGLPPPPRPAQHPLFQTPALPPPFLRPSPGPIRPAVGSAILFSPY
ncbi:hypothetical protein ANANG_G00282690 [Anguilla anguilla]|uniref:Zinc finger protein 385B n=1 Tax=Anguilla anguilla TaxID=7936 RepID=A0A9D3RKT2_ANGAN|nr:hypothetical protein ANANG_G00282690 [Anguilla anguilla]